MLSIFAISSHAQISLNVTNFGAVGDAVQFYANTVSNSVVVTTTNRFSSDDIGKSIEVFGVGKQTYGKNSYGVTNYGNEDLIATITNVVNRTNIYIDKICQQTLADTFTTVGHDNATHFQSAVDACAGLTNAILNIPTGKYLLLSSYRTTDPSCYYSVALRSGGIHILGEGTNNTVLLGQGAWIQTNNLCKRGFIFAVPPPIINDYPVSIESLTMDGGVEHGKINIVGTYPNPVDGLGWDGSHGAYDIRGFSGRVFTQQTWTNLLFTHWRGEMVKSNDGNTNGNINIFNCTFSDGNATAINIYASLNISNCVFDNLFQVAEYYMKYSTNTSYVQNCLFTNIWGNGFAFNGAIGKNPPYYILSNTIYMSGNSYSAVLTTPGDNIYIISNKFIYPNGAYSGATAIALGVPGYQGYFNNSNIVIAANVFINPSVILQLSGLISENNYCESIWMTNNVISNAVGNEDHGTALLTTYGYATNIYISGNVFSGFPNDTVSSSSGARGGQYALITTNNTYWSRLYDLTANTNVISYANGPRRNIIYRYCSGTKYALMNTNSSQIPAGAQISIKNSTTEYGAGTTVPVYLNSALTGIPVMIPKGEVAAFSWNRGAWSLDAPMAAITAPKNLSLVK